MTLGYFTIEEANRFWLAQKHYDREISLRYTHDWVKWFRHRAQERALKRSLHQYRPESILEVGCGTGRLFPLYKSIPGKKVGIDLNPTQLKHAESKAAKYRIKLKSMSAYKLDFDPNAFDGLVYSEVLLHIPYDGIAIVLSEARRVARRFIFVVDNYFDELSDAEIESIRTGAAKHCFVHKYIQLFRGMGFEAAYVRRVPYSTNAVYTFRRVTEGCMS